jgi:hypothetical protein
MTIEKTFQGAYKISSILWGELLTRQYFFPKKEAVKLFRETLMHEFLKHTIGWQSIASTQKKTAERLEQKGIIVIQRYENANWQVKLK